jgi:hypothetical protein
MGSGKGRPQFEESIRSPIHRKTDRTGCQRQDPTDATVSTATSGNGRSTELSRTALAIGLSSYEFSRVLEKYGLAFNVLDKDFIPIVVVIVIVVIIVIVILQLSRAV